MALVRFLKFDATYGGHRQHDPTTDELNVLGLQVGTNGIAMGGNDLSGLPSTPPTSSSAASKDYVDSLLSGLTWREPVSVLSMVDDGTSGPPTLGTGDAGNAYVVDVASGAWGSYGVGDIVEWDGSAWAQVVVNSGGVPPDGTRVVVSDSPAVGSSFAGEANNIGTYETGTGWTFDTSLNSWAVLVTGASGYYENTAWVYDSTPGAWVQFSGAGQISAGSGLDKTGNTLFIGNGNGIQINADSIEVELSAVNPGLELSGTSPNATLQVLVDGAHGVVLGASGVELELDDTPDTLDVDSDGLKVVGLPSLFKINDVNVGATVTAANLDDLTDGSNADSLHTHNITDVDEASRVEDTHENNVTITTGEAVRWSGTNNQLTQAANNTFPNSRVIGVARSGGAASPGTSEVVKHGICQNVLTAATVNTPYFLGSSGALVTYGSLPVPGRVVRMGYAVNATDLDVQIMDLGFRAV